MKISRLHSDARPYGLTFVVSLLIGILAAQLFAQSPINVLNHSSELNGKTLLTAEGSYTISGANSFGSVQLFSGGTAGAPGIGGTADATTGMLLGSGSVTLSVGGTSRFLITSTNASFYGNALVNSSGKIPALSSTYFSSLDGSNLTNVSGVPVGAILFFNGACGIGFSEFTDARGRYIVGLVSGGTLDTPIGSALTDQENRATGNHTHNLGGYAARSGGAPDGSTFGWQAEPNTAFTPATQNTSGVSGAPSGTNAPYIQLRVCYKT